MPIIRSSPNTSQCFPHNSRVRAEGTKCGNALLAHLHVNKALRQITLDLNKTLIAWGWNARFSSFLPLLLRNRQAACTVNMHVWVLRKFPALHHLAFWKLLACIKVLIRVLNAIGAAQEGDYKLWTVYGIKNLNRAVNATSSFSTDIIKQILPLGVSSVYSVFAL